MTHIPHQPHHGSLLRALAWLLAALAFAVLALAAA